ncbi:helix-turn-helix transcriptional regulator [Aerococcaceae bacterium zg-ZJ1578]|uniref:helix-turn-helix domain-containing protein n=1 Tax=Aerococcaceae bacterium zg-252 TaxID=2796928 RepID=UPI001A267E36|nr:helix-turn-helix transcriptional regulator [Aerococcaceae bacterium zg-1578]
MEYMLKIKEIRKAKHMTQQQVYQDICSDRHYSRIENNQSNISIYLLLEFAERLNCMVDDLIIKVK